MRFTCLIPTHKNGEVIRTAIDSVLAQTVEDLELFVVCDGAPAETLAIVVEATARDARVRPFLFDKGERHGEAWRHIALQEATGEAVCYLGDDDFWLPDHLAHMEALLADADFAHTRQTIVWPTFEVNGPVNDIADAATRQALAQTRYNYFGPSVTGHRLDAYRRLPQGWAPAPAGLWTDLHMWRKWIAAEDVRFASSMAVTSLHFPRSLRQEQDRHTAVQENAFWRETFSDPIMRQALRDLMTASDQRIPLATVLARARHLRAEQADRLRETHAAEVKALAQSRDALQDELDAAGSGAARSTR
jgi:hypothetical protein